jgi:hypothetical protein
VNEDRQYRRRHLLDHLREAQFSDDEIVIRLQLIPESNPDKAYFIEQFLASLSEDLREEYANKLK